MARAHLHEYVVIGLGRFGASLALTLMDKGHSVLGIDRDPEIIQHLADSLTQAVALDATDEAALREAGVPAFDTVVVAIGAEFEANLLTTAALKALGVRQVICKALTERQRDILLKVGADRVILPEHEAGQRLAEELSVPGLVDHIPLGREHRITELRVPAVMAGRSLQELDVRGRHGLTVLAVQRGEELTTAPPPGFRLAQGDLVVVLGRPADLHAFSEHAA